MILAFVLSMPNVGSWNGQWTSASKFFAKTRNLPKKKAEEILEKENFYYNFGDGWGANVKVKKVLSKESAQIKRNSKGFCGYDWMIDSIVDNLKIKTD